MTTVRRRRGFTLIELLVVIGIMLVVASLGYYLLSSLVGNQTRTRAIDQLTEWLLTTKMQARRDGQATGLRLLYNGAPAAPGTTANQVAFVQQPDPLTGGTCDGPCDATGTLSTGSGTYVRFNAASVDLLGPGAAMTPPDLTQSLVQPGDYLEVNASGSVHQIINVTQVTVGTTTYTLLNLASTVPYFTATSNYRVFRQPRLLVGEEIKPLGAELVIDMSAGKCLNLPVRTILGTTSAFVEIVFSPSGSVVGQGTNAGKIVLWLADQTVSHNPGPPALIAVNTRTGFIGAYDVNGTPDPTSGILDPYLFTEDGRSGGF
jgi:prepilin-type N-terminal cleavage/methylation domain-containing protein